MRSAVITFAILVSTLTNLFASADSLMTRIVLLEKQVMLEASDSLKAHLLLDKAIAYRQLEQPHDALLSLWRLKAEFLTSAYKAVYYYEKAINLYTTQAYAEALSELRNLEEEFSPLAPEAELLGLMLLLENSMWPEFKEQYVKVASRQGIDTSNFLHTFEPPQYKDPHHYKRLSGIVPGLGLIQGGYVTKGLSSISLQVVSLGFAAYNIYQGFYFTSVFSGLMPARRFYRGGRALTFNTIEKENADSLSAFKALGYQHLQKLY